MSYGKPIAAVVLGALSVHVGFALAPEWTRLEAAELSTALATNGLLVVAGLSLAAYGLFAGIEAAVAAGRDDGPAPDAAG